MMDTISEALALYTGWGRSPFPRSDAAAVFEGLGQSRGRPPLRRSGSFSMRWMSPGWRRHTLKSATEWAQSEMKRRHPDLSDEALRLAGWSVSCGWK
jgi:hypothetical protein